jgi:deoxyinosine 3'endonuclease (endonuclease V)
VDGQGVQHLRVLGVATSLGIKVNIPTIGVAKSYFEVDGMTKKECKEACNRELTKSGDYLTLMDSDGINWGAALKCTEETTAPIYISLGHRISLETSIKIVKMCINGSKIPIPIREADLRGRVLVRKIFDNDNKEKE